MLTDAGIRADLIQQERPHCVSHAHRGGNERGDYLLGNLTCLSPSCSFPPLRLKETPKRTVKTFAIAPRRAFLWTGNLKKKRSPVPRVAPDRRSFNEKEKRVRCTSRRRRRRRKRSRENTALCDIPRCEGGGVAEGVRSEKQEKVMGSATGGTGERAQRVGLGNGGPG